MEDLRCLNDLRALAIEFTRVTADDVRQVQELEQSPNLHLAQCSRSDRHFSDILWENIQMRFTTTNALVAIVLLAACGFSFGVTVDLEWNKHIRPPVSLHEAIETAEKALGEDAENRYCVDAQLSDTATFDLKDAEWTFLFAAQDGSQKIVEVNMNREATLSNWNEAMDWEKNSVPRQDLREVETRLKDLFKEKQLDVSLDMIGDRLVGSFRTRPYRVHRQEADRAYSKELFDVVGPAHDGFSFEAEEVTGERAKEALSVRYESEDHPYWLGNMEAYPTVTEGRAIVVHVRYGKDFPFDLSTQISHAFGAKPRFAFSGGF